jgi:hypothetical protein
MKNVSDLFNTLQEIISDMADEKGYNSFIKYNNEDDRYLKRKTIVVVRDTEENALGQIIFNYEDFKTKLTIMIFDAYNKNFEVKSFIYSIASEVERHIRNHEQE